MNAFGSRVRLDTAARHAVLEATEKGVCAVSIYLRDMVHAEAAECEPSPNRLFAIPRAWTQISPGVNRLVKDLLAQHGLWTWSEPYGVDRQLQEVWIGTPDGFHGLPSRSDIPAYRVQKADA
jgi:hypothetical protein